MRTELDYQWDILEEEIPGLFTQLEKAVLKTLRVLRAKIEGWLVFRVTGEFIESREYWD